MSTFIEESIHQLKPRIALIACGSFSPPTPMHLRMFEIAKDYFEMQGTHTVIGGIVSPTHDAYGKKGLAPASHRCAMVRLALQTSSWIRLSDWEVKQSGWTRTREVLQYHQNYMNNLINGNDEDEDHDELDRTGDNVRVEPGWLPGTLRERRDGVRLKLLCGADLLESFAVPGLWADEDIENIVCNHGIVVVSRFGSNPEKFIFESDILTKYQRNITLVTNWVPNEVSSSMVRRLLNRGQSVKYLLDDLVLEYIQKHHLFNYKSCSNADRAHKPQMFCCGKDSLDGSNKQEGKNVHRKFLMNRNGPGQVVQVITTAADMMSVSTKTKCLKDDEESKAKKMRTSASAQDV